MDGSTHPLLYQINTRVYLTELSRKLGKSASLDDIPDSYLDELAGLGFDWIWLTSVWQTGRAGRNVSRANQQWRKEFEETLPDLTEADIEGSGFAIQDYSVQPNLGGSEALARLRKRFKKRNLKLLLDFVPNHMAMDHPWVDSHPQFFIAASEDDLSRAPSDYTRIKVGAKERIFAHGRDPYFPGWPDTLQLNYAEPALQEAMIEELLKIASQCDGVRCDMAMLVLPEIFQRTWGLRSEPFWQKAIGKVRSAAPEFCFMAEVYWDMEWTLQHVGFDFTYDKRLYDRLREGDATAIRDHLRASIDYQSKMARFLENHDEPRAAQTFGVEQHKAAAAVTFLSPGMRFFHQGQLEGKRKRVSPHLVRAPEEPIERELRAFYEWLLSVLRLPLLHRGRWQLLNPSPAWEGNWTSNCFISYLWAGDGDEHLLVVVNYAANQSQCYLTLPVTGSDEGQWQLRDLVDDVVYFRDGRDLSSRGLYVDLAPWHVHVFALAGWTEANLKVMLQK